MMLDVRVSLQFKHKNTKHVTLMMYLLVLEEQKRSLDTSSFFNLSLAPKQPATAERMHLTH